MVGSRLLRGLNSVASASSSDMGGSRAAGRRPAGPWPASGQPSFRPACQPATDPNLSHRQRVRSFWSGRATCGPPLRRQNRRTGCSIKGNAAACKCAPTSVGQSPSRDGGPPPGKSRSPCQPAVKVGSSAGGKGECVVSSGTCDPLKPSPVADAGHLFRWLPAAGDQPVPFSPFGLACRSITL